MSFRCKRTICDYCHGAGWVETGDDPVLLPDIEMTAGGYPKWTTRFAPKGEVTALAPDQARLILP